MGDVPNPGARLSVTLSKDVSYIHACFVLGLYMWFTKHAVYVSSARRR